jgi:hypothetical protein
MLALKVVLFIIITATVVGIIINENVKNLHDTFLLILNSTVLFFSIKLLIDVTHIWEMITSGVVIVFSTINVILIIIASRQEKKGD